MKKTPRGFSYVQFVDLYGQQCSLQKSSLATKDAIWLGVENTGPNLDGPGGGRNEDIRARMHLSQKEVKKLLPKLIKFAESGEL
jgi:hypothetical protein